MYQNLHTVVKPQKIINHIVQVNLILKGNMMFSFFLFGLLATCAGKKQTTLTL